MGRRTTRITAEDFLIPQEFRAYRLAERSSGQIGGVALELVEASGRTRLGHCYQQTPLRVFPPFHFENEPAALLYLINPTAGLLDGDGHLIDIEAGAGTCAVITGQSATRVHPALSRFATQQWRIRVADGARLVVLPGPNIPYQGCRYAQRAEIHLEGNARLIWGDIWTPGRYERGDLSERQQFDQIVQEMEVRRDGILVYRDRFHWEGPWDVTTAGWHVGDGLTTGSASLFITGPAEASNAVPAASLRRAILPLASGDTVIRSCGPTENLISDVVRTALRLAASWTEDPPRSHWLLASNNLGTTHWFSVGL